MNGLIRNFKDEDYAAIVDVSNLVNPDHPTTERNMKHWDKNREKRVVWNRLVYEEDGEVLATANYSLMSWMFHPQKYAGSILVPPKHRGRGIGGALLDGIHAAIAERDAISLRGNVREDRPEAIRFAEKRGFVAGLLEQESSLDLLKFDPSAFTDALERMEGTGIQLMTFDELSNDPERGFKLYEMEGASEKDMPAPEPLTQPDFETYCKLVYENPNFRGETVLIAVDGEDYVGVSSLWSQSIPTRLEVGYTGVLREYRGRGIATALKVAVTGKAKDLGYKEAITTNDSTNVGMLGINRRLGFEKRPAWVDYEIKLGAQADAAPKSEPENEEIS